MVCVERPLFDLSTHLKPNCFDTRKSCSVLWLGTWHYKLAELFRRKIILHAVCISCDTMRTCRVQIPVVGGSIRAGLTYGNDTMRLEDNFVPAAEFSKLGASNRSAFAQFQPGPCSGPRRCTTCRPPTASIGCNIYMSAEQHCLLHWKPSDYKKPR